MRPGLSRRLALPVAGLILPAAVRYQERLGEAAALVDAGNGLLVLMNHFSQRDGLQVLRLLYGQPLLRTRSTLTPVASHLITPLVRSLADLFTVELAPITSPEAVETLGLDPATGQNPLDYARAAVRLLGEGGIVLLAPQAGRRPCLEAPEMRPVSLLLAQARRRRVTDLILLPVGLGIPREMDYSLENTGGLNLLRRYVVSVGRPTMLEEAVTAAGGWRQMDRWALDQLGELVPEAYRSCG